MINFAVEKVDEIKDGKLSFYKLVINGECLYDEFCKEVEKSAESKRSLNTIRAYMNFIADCDSRLPGAKFNSIKDKGKVVGYEFKKDALRVYVMKQNPDVYVVLGGYKKIQERNITTFVQIAKEFREYIKNEQNKVTLLQK